MSNLETGFVIWRRHEWDPEKYYPYCSLHGAMNKVSKFGMWRCICCHIGYDETTQENLAGSHEGFKKLLAE